MAEPQATPTTVSLEHKLDDARAAGADPEASRTHGCGAPVGAPGGGSPGRLGLFRALVPASAGGEEWDWSTWMRVVEELSTVDGAVGWLAGVGGSVNAIASGWVSADVGRTVFCTDPIGFIAGSGAPRGTARSTDGGYLVSGRWQFGSGSPHACWFKAGFIVEGEAPRFGRMMLVPAKDVEIIDTWSVGGDAWHRQSRLRCPQSLCPDGVHRERGR
jgi:alkylation response protein AidB-like acyl-CoA dehydrogenase